MDKYLLLLAGLLAAVAAAPTNPYPEIPSVVEAAVTHSFGRAGHDADQVAAALRRGEDPPSDSDPGAVMFCKEPYYQDCQIIKVSNKCAKLPYASISSLLQWKGAICFWYTLDDCREIPGWPKYVLDSKQTGLAWPEIGSPWNNKFWSISCSITGDGTPPHSLEARLDRRSLATAESTQYEPNGSPGDLQLCTGDNFVGCVRQNALNKCVIWPSRLHSLVQYRGAKCVFYKDKSCKGSPWYTLETPDATSTWELIPVPYDDWYHAVKCQPIAKTVEKRDDMEDDLHLTNDTPTLHLAGTEDLSSYGTTTDTAGTVPDWNPGLVQVCTQKNFQTCWTKNLLYRCAYIDDPIRSVKQWPGALCHYFADKACMDERGTINTAPGTKSWPDMGEYDAQFHAIYCSPVSAPSLSKRDSIDAYITQATLEETSFADVVPFSELATTQGDQDPGNLEVCIGSLDECYSLDANGACVELAKPLYGVRQYKGAKCTFGTDKDCGGRGAIILNSKGDVRDWRPMFNYEGKFNSIGCRT